MNVNKKIEMLLEKCVMEYREYLSKRFGIKIPNGKLNIYANKNLEKMSLYSISKFQKNGHIEIDIAWDILREGKRKMITMAIRKEAIRYYVYRKKADYTNKGKEFNRILKSEKLLAPEGYPERGLELHTYRCAKCKNIFPDLLFIKRPPRNKDLSLNPKYRTPCHKALFEYVGAIHYDNEKIKKIDKVSKQNFKIQ